MSLRTVCCGPAARHFTQTIGPTSGSVSGTPLKHTRYHVRLPFLRTIHITAAPRTQARFIIPRHNGNRYKLMQLCRLSRAHALAQSQPQVPVVHDSLYGYVPTESVCAIFIALFGLSTRMFRVPFAQRVLTHVCGQ